MNIEPHIVSISVSRLYNLGNYEHIKYELSAVCGPGSAAQTMVGIERILEALKPNRTLKDSEDIEREQRALDEMKTMPLAEFERRHGQPVGGPAEYIKRVQESLDNDRKRFSDYINRQKTARALLNDLGGAAEYKDSKMDWDYDLH